jgi:small-conductance mechanosensitive channel
MRKQREKKMYKIRCPIVAGFILWAICISPADTQMPFTAGAHEKEPEIAQNNAAMEDTIIAAGKMAVAVKVKGEEEPIKAIDGVVRRTWKKCMGADSPYRSLVLTLLTLLIVIYIKASLTRVMSNYLKENAHKAENASNFFKVWNGVWKFVIAVLAVIAMSGSLRLLGLTAGFLGMMLGWSLQQPVTGVAAWLMIILKRPFRIGDRVIIAGTTGDVTDITLTHVILNQVGGSVGGEERSGRGILIPNAILFQNTIINYTLEQEHMLDEVPVRLTFDSDWDEAKRIMVAAAKDITGEIVKKTGEEPFIRAEFLDWGIMVRLRYNTIPVRRQEISTDIIERLLKDFGAAYPRIRFAIPSSSIRYRRESERSAAPDKKPGIRTGEHNRGHAPMQKEEI